MIIIDPGHGVSIEEQKLMGELLMSLDASRYTKPTACVTLIGATFTGALVGKEITPATKLADPAFANALRPRPFRIGLRYLGD